jgi:hypothetical protein
MLRGTVPANLAGTAFEQLPVLPSGFYAPVRFFFLSAGGRPDWMGPPAVPGPVPGLGLSV